MTNWKPIAEFKPEIVGDNQQIAVWIEDENGNGEAFMAQIGGMTVTDDNGEPVALGDDAFVGEWRAMEELSHLEPVAFALIDAYEPVDLDRVGLPVGHPHLEGKEIYRGPGGSNAVEAA